MPAEPASWKGTTFLMTNNTEKQKFKLLAYGIERKGLTPPTEPIIDRNYTLIFEPFETQRRFNEFDGVVVFQGAFESFTWKTDWSGDPYVIHSYKRNELDKRTKELQLLLKKGGFICFLLCERFIDRHKSQDYRGTDLTKIGLNLQSFYRENYGSRATALQVKRNEFLKFFEIYGAANSYFSNHNSQIDMRVLAKVRGDAVSIVLSDKMFVIPCLLPENISDRIEEFFCLLSDALISTRKKLHVEIPDWVNEFKFETELALLEERSRLLAEAEDKDAQIIQFERYKRILLFDGDMLVDCVGEVLRKGFGLKTDTHDELKEDLKILDDEGQPIIFLEIKGTNRGLKREHVNQTDSHRERAELPVDFPTILIVNTHIKNSRNLTEKDQDLPAEQVRHAAKTNVLVLRTYDLLKLLKLHLTGQLSREIVLELLTKNSGWLRVTDEKAEVETE